MNTNSNPIVTTEQPVQLIEYCSYKCNYPESVTRNTGVENLCQAMGAGFNDKDTIENGWILVNRNQQESVIVSFQTSVFISEIHIYESLNAGCIVKLELFECQKNKWWIMWQENSHENERLSTFNVFKPILRRYHFKSNTIRMTIDPRYTDRIGIQAVKLIGSNIFDANFNHITLQQAMVSLYEQVLNNNQLDVQFIIDNKIINVHRNIICCRCSYFRALLLDDFSEKNQRVPIKLTNIDYETFMELLFFVYTGTYHKTLTYEMAIKCMIYSNKINFLTGKTAAFEEICYHLCLNHDLIISLYCLVKQMSPEFDSLLDYIYDLCSQHMKEICSQKEFSELDKDLMINLICQSAQRRDIREQENNKQTTTL